MHVRTPLSHATAPGGCSNTFVHRLQTFTYVWQPRRILGGVFLSHDDLALPEVGAYVYIMVYLRCCLMCPRCVGLGQTGLLLTPVNPRMLSKPPSSRWTTSRQWPVRIRARGALGSTDDGTPEHVSTYAFATASAQIASHTSTSADIDTLQLHVSARAKTVANASACTAVTPR